MPWKETGVVDLREEFVLRSLVEGQGFAPLCREYGVSPKTGYKWRKRFIADGRKGLKDGSRRPHSSPRQLGEEAICRLVLLKLAHRSWGPLKIFDLYRRIYGETRGFCLSTVKRVFGKAGLIEPRRRRRHDECGRIESSVPVEEPNDLWTVDFKGEWYSSDKRRVEPLTVRDAFSRYVFCTEPLGKGSTKVVKPKFEELFMEYGVPKAIRSDNGPPFASMRSPRGLTRLSAWWVALGIVLDRITPGHPQENGAHERMHRDIAMEVEGTVDGDFRTQVEVLEMWRENFNRVRPHEALGMRVPAEVYVKSSRRYEEGVFELEYPPEYLRRRVSRTGAIGIDSIQINISLAVAGWEIGLKPTGCGEYGVWFGPIYLGQVDTTNRAFKAAR
jgi:putative transposase